MLSTLCFPRSHSWSLVYHCPLKKIVIENPPFAKLFPVECLIISSTLLERYYCPHCIDEETEAQRDTKPCSSQQAGLGLVPVSSVP